ncbi:MAG: hypothetical protein PHW10_00500 [Candidatus Peribacteraceae bacterium]|nr:hypothetical protein [Candidatus Peribacteraceae bacterium]
MQLNVIQALIQVNCATTPEERRERARDFGQALGREIGLGRRSTLALLQDVVDAGETQGEVGAFVHALLGGYVERARAVMHAKEQDALARKQLHHVILETLSEMLESVSGNSDDFSDGLTLEDLAQKTTAGEGQVAAALRELREENLVDCVADEAAHKVRYYITTEGIMTLQLSGEQRDGETAGKEV